MPFLSLRDIPKKGEVVVGVGVVGGNGEMGVAGVVYLVGVVVAAVMVLVLQGSLRRVWTGWTGVWTGICFDWLGWLEWPGVCSDGVLTAVLVGVLVGPSPTRSLNPSKIAIESLNECLALRVAVLNVERCGM